MKIVSEEYAGILGHAVRHILVADGADVGRCSVCGKVLMPPFYYCRDGWYVCYACERSGIVVCNFVLNVKHSEHIHFLVSEVRK